MKLISFNIGIKIHNSKEIGEFINSEEPDVVALQEIMRHLDDSVFEMYKSKTEIEKVISEKLPYSFFGPLWITNKMKMNGKIHRDFNGFVEQGNQIISRFPIKKATNEFFYQNYSLITDWSDFHTMDHPRAVQVMELDVNGKRLQVLNVHGTYTKDKKDNERTIKQCQHILNSAKKHLPTIIVGDFNLLPNTKSIELLDKEYFNLIKLYYIKTTRPDFQDEHDTGNNVVDYIFVNNKIKVRDFKVINTSISDHLPLVLDFEIMD